MSTRMERRWERQTKKRRSALRFAAELLAVIVLAALCLLYTSRCV